MPGVEGCFFHDPSTAVARSEAGRKGAAESNRRRKKTFDVPVLETAADARALLAELPRLVLSGEIEHTAARTVTATVRQFLDALKAEQADDNTERLEKMARTIADLKADLE